MAIDTYAPRAHPQGMKKLIGLMMLSTVACLAQTPAAELTVGVHNGRSWVQMESGHKIAYVIGYSDFVKRWAAPGSAPGSAPWIGDAGSPVGDVVDQIHAENQTNMMPEGTIGDTVAALDLFYQKPENRVISVPDAILIYARKTQGLPDPTNAVRKASFEASK